MKCRKALVFPVPATGQHLGLTYRCYLRYSSRLPFLELCFLLSGRLRPLDPPVHSLFAEVPVCITSFILFPELQTCLLLFSLTDSLKCCHFVILNQIDSELKCFPCKVNSFSFIYLFVLVILTFS